MVNPVILEYLEKHSKKYKVEDLKRKIVSSGYSEKEAEEALANLGLKQEKTEKEEETSESKRTGLASEEDAAEEEEAEEEKNFEEVEEGLDQIEEKATKKPIFMKVIAIVMVILLANVAFFIFRYGNLNKGLTGFSVKEVVSNSYQDLSPFSRILLIGQWIALVFILAMVYIRDKNIEIQQDEISDIEFKQMNDGKATDLDALYNLLQSKGHLRVSTISRLFDVKKGIALEWCKILESGNLAIIDYPSSKEPVVKFVVK